MYFPKQVEFLKDRLIACVKLSFMLQNKVMKYIVVNNVFSLNFFSRLTNLISFNMKTKTVKKLILKRGRVVALW